MAQSSNTTVPSANTNARVGIGNSSQRINWSSFYSTGNYPTIGYDPASDKIVVLKSTDQSVTSVGPAFIFDMKSGSWSSSSLATPAGYDLTNFVINPSGELIIKQIHPSLAGNNKFYKWSETGYARDTFLYQTKAFDMGAPGLKKRLLKVIVHAKDGTNVDVKVSYDGGTASDVFTESNELNGSASFTKNELTVTTPTNFSYVSIALDSSDDVETSFEVNDISLIYRLLGVR